MDRKYFKKQTSCQLDILNSWSQDHKVSFCGCESSVITSAMEEYATRKMIDENLSMLKMAELHMDKRATSVLRLRISDLESTLI